jgi:hypothetical protein
MKLNDLEAKAEILSYGIRLSHNAQRCINDYFLIKRRVYGNPDTSSYLSVHTPQEVVFKELPIVANAIYNEYTPWIVDIVGNEFLLTNTHYSDIPITFTKRPAYYDMSISSGVPVRSILTFLFGHTLGIFVSTSCLHASRHMQCQFCSIRDNRERPKDILQQPSNVDIYQAVEVAINNCSNDVDCVFISGGNLELSNNDNFIYYAEIALSIIRLIRKYEKQINVTLNVFPPNDLQLIDILAGCGVNVVFSQEIFDTSLFTSFCPGKALSLDKTSIEKTLRKYVDTLGMHHVYCFLIQGIESDQSLLNGVNYFADLGTCPIIHILHVDPNTPLSKLKYSPPTPDHILSVAKYVSEIYSAYGFNSSKIYGGRSSFDKEASLHFI